MYLRVPCVIVVRSRPTHIPAIAALRALDAAVRHMSFTKAAEELHISQSAVSHQIAYLEQLWGIQLFDRRPRRVEPTREGEALALVVRSFIHQLRSTLDGMDGQPSPADRLKISTTESFALAWLLPRLHKFTQKARDIDVWISTSDSLVDFHSDEFDVAIRLCTTTPPDLEATFVLREYVFPVCSPRLLERISVPQKPRDLLKLPLLFREPVRAGPNWDEWFRYYGIIEGIPDRGLRFPDSFMAIQAALTGQGVALARSAHVVEFLKRKDLVKLLDDAMLSPAAYYFVCPKGQDQNPHINVLKDWLIAEAADDQVEFQHQATLRGPSAREGPATQDG